MRKAMVFGAGVSGIGAKNLLEKIGWKVYLVDDGKGIKSKEAIGLLDEVELFIKSPGIPYVELVKEAMKNGIEVIDELELAYRELSKLGVDTKIIAVTGTNGKTTVTSKIKEMLTFSGKTSEYAGNIGVSFADLVIDIKAGKQVDFIVLEMSSYQLENLKYFKADISLIINLAPDHLDRYNSLEEYYQAKLNIRNNQDKNDYFILNLDSEEIVERSGKVNSKIMTLSRVKKNSNLYCMGNNIYYKSKKIAEIDKLSLKGQHNLENILFILAIGIILEISIKSMIEFLYNTESLEHRMEEFFKSGKSLFVNDSKGTNIESSIMAIEAYKNPILICGGVDKKLLIAPLIKVIKESVKEVYLIGELASLIEKGLLETGFEKSRVHNLRTLEKVMETLEKRIDIGDENTILLSPATASFDQFKNYIVRGNEFKRLVKKHFGRDEQI